MSCRGLFSLLFGAGFGIGRSYAAHGICGLLGSRQQVHAVPPVRRRSVPVRSAVSREPSGVAPQMLRSLLSRPPCPQRNTAPQGNRKLPFHFAARMLRILDLKNSVGRGQGFCFKGKLTLRGDQRHLELSKLQLNLTFQESRGQIKIGFCLQ